MRSRCRIAIVWAIMPPIEVPTMWAFSMPRQSSTPMLSSAMSSSVYADLRSRLASWISDGVGRAVEVGRAADVAVVVPDHEEAAARELGAEVVLVGDHLRAEAHDQQHRGVGRVAEGLVTDVDVADAAGGLGHHLRLTAWGETQAVRG